jgi:capsular polysaccharide export protein
VDVNIATGAAPRSFLFLQGPIGLFFSRLARRLSGNGHVVHRINLHGGDRLFWRLPGAVDFRGDSAVWPAFVADYLDDWEITDLVLFGDCRPMHRAALCAAAARGVAAHVFEEGYLRPDWITLERDGVNANSTLPRDPRYYREAAASTTLSDGGQTITHSFVRRAFEDVLYHTTMVITRDYFRGYRTHRPWHPYVEYAYAAGRYLREPFGKRRAARFAERFATRSQLYYLFPLQLDSDTQIRHHSPFRRMQPAVEHVIQSFARHAPADALLVVTEHPLETGVIDLKRFAWQCALDTGVGSRLVYLKGGTPPNLLRRCRAVVTVNSTLGIQAMGCGVPVIALGDAIYGLPGLTYQGALQEFWQNAVPADPVLFDAFRRVLAVRTQINGGFYSATGIAVAVSHAVDRLQQGSTLAAPRRDRVNAISASRTSSVH